MQTAPPLLAWEAHEFEHQEKTSDWYWGLGVIALVLAVAALFFNNIILAVLVVVAAGVIGIVTQTEHFPSQFVITQRGIRIDDTFHSFATLESFWIDHSHEVRIPRLLVKSVKTFTPLIVISLDGVDPDDVQEILSHFLAQEPHSEPFAHRLFERLGF